MFWNSELIKQKRAMKQLGKIIFNTIESLRKKQMRQKQPNEDTPATMEKLKEWTILLDKEKLLDKPQ